MQRVKELDGLRAVAILLVLGCHYRGFASLLGGVPEFGYIGVDIFFVLSGYLITTILLALRGQAHPYWTFYSRRAVRIFPPYFASVAAIVAIGVAVHDSLVTSSAFAFRQVFFLQAYNIPYLPYVFGLLMHPVEGLRHFPSLLANAHHLPRPQVGITLDLISAANTYWSLSIEEYFYLLWAPVVLLLRRGAVVAVGVAVCVAEMVIRWGYGGSSAEYFGLIFRFDALMYGAMLALLVTRWNPRAIPRGAGRVFAGIFWAAVVGVAVILFLLRPVVGYEVRDSPLFLVLGLPLISVGAAAVVGLLVLRSGSGWWLARVMRWRAMQYLGTISYTMYLVHVLAAIAMEHALGWLGRSMHHGLFFVEAVLSTLLTIGIARASWHFMEKPLLRWKDRRFPATRVAEPVLN
jgi:peptidoglycan/LPS O-acetylase OafA/YrhL